MIAVAAIGGAFYLGAASRQPETAAVTQPATVHISGVLYLPGAPKWQIGSTCGDMGGLTKWRGVHSGSQIQVVDGAQTTLVVDVIGTGIVFDSPTLPGYTTACRFPFSINAPAGKGVYGIKVPPFNAVQYNEADLGKEITITVN